MMEAEALKRRIYARIDELPTIPAVIPRLARVLADEGHEIKEAIEVISQDPALTSKILKVANSAYYGFPQEITTLERAVALLGSNMVKSLAVSVGVVHSLPKGKGCGAFSLNGLWVHSLAVANAARKLSALAEAKGREEVYFIMGLLHDIGKLVLAEFFPEEFAESLGQTVKCNIPLAQAEKETIGMDHGEVGGMLLERWKFPAEIRIPIQLHHREGQVPNEYKKAVRLLHIADEIAREVGVGEAGNMAPPSVLEAELDQLRIKGGELEKVKQSLEASAEELQNLFHVMS